MFVITHVWYMGPKRKATTFNPTSWHPYWMLVPEISLVREDKTNGEVIALEEK